MELVVEAVVGEGVGGTVIVIVRLTSGGLETTSSLEILDSPCADLRGYEAVDAIGLLRGKELEVEPLGAPPVTIFVVAVGFQETGDAVGNGTHGAALASCYKGVKLQDYGSIVFRGALLRRMARARL